VKEPGVLEVGSEIMKKIDDKILNFLEGPQRTFHMYVAKAKNVSKKRGKVE
jgi:hypothetical protein